MRGQECGEQGVQGNQSRSEIDIVYTSDLLRIQRMRLHIHTKSLEFSSKKIYIFYVLINYDIYDT